MQHIIYSDKATLTQSFIENYLAITEFLAGVRTSLIYLLLTLHKMQLIKNVQNN